jgi:hypothetical protein
MSATVGTATGPLPVPGMADCTCPCCTRRKTSSLRRRQRALVTAEVLVGTIALCFGVCCAWLVATGAAPAGEPCGAAGMFFLVTLGFMDKFRRSE